MARIELWHGLQDKYVCGTYVRICAHQSSDNLPYGMIPAVNVLCVTTAEAVHRIVGEFNL
jgi:hypothetical protein